MSLKEPLKSVLKEFFHVEVYDVLLLRQCISSGKGFAYDADLFKSQLREAIDNRLISPEEYEELTEEDFDSQDDLQEWLEEVWEDLNYQEWCIHCPNSDMYPEPKG